MLALYSDPGLRGGSVRDRLLRRLGWAFFLWKPLFCFADADIRSGTGSIFRLARARVEERRAAFVSASATAALILWNLGLIFQWGTHLIPARGPISWRDAAYNQFAVVPVEASQTVKNYLTGRKGMMDHIEQEDVNHLKSDHTSQ